MKKREGFWFTVISYILANWFGYHLSKMPTKGAGRKKQELTENERIEVIESVQESLGGLPRVITGTYPKAGE